MDVEFHTLYRIGGRFVNRTYEFINLPNLKARKSFAPPLLNANMKIYEGKALCLLFSPTKEV